MASNAFNSLLEGINAQIKALNHNNLKIYDADNPEFFISIIKYDKEADKLVFSTDMDPEESRRLYSDKEDFHG